MLDTKCWNCGTNLELPGPPISFRADCEKCGAWQHVCKNCEHYCPGRANDCMIPDTDPINDREKYNYCEEFHLLGKAGNKNMSSKDDIERRLFGDL
jgi:hypothetical protein